MSIDSKSEQRLAHGWPISRVRRCLDKRNASALVNFLRERYEQRFFRPITILTKAKGNDEGYGFAVMALSCLLAETLQSYWEGWPSTHHKELAQLHKYNPPAEYQVPKNEWPKKLEDVFKALFSNPVFSRFFGGVDAVEFCRCIRNALLHQAQTRHGWRIQIGRTQVWDDSERIVDRNLFAKAMKRAFDGYLAELTNTSDPNNIRWKHARRKIWWLIKLSEHQAIT